MSVEPIVLQSGSHSSPEAGMCFNEAAAYLAGERFSDAPKCVSPVVRRFTMTLNDRLDDQDRQKLRPFVLRALGTAGDGRDDERMRMCVEWLAKESALPVYLDMAGLVDEAARVRAISPDMTMANIRDLLADVRRASWKVRENRWAETRRRIKEQLIEKWTDAATAAATAATDADDATDAAATATAATADAAAATDAAAAAAAADATAVGVPPTYGSPEYYEWRRGIYDAVYKAVRPIYDEALAKVFGPKETRLDSALALLDRMLPEQPLAAPAVENAAELVSA